MVDERCDGDGCAPSSVDDVLLRAPVDLDCAAAAVTTSTLAHSFTCDGAACSESWQVAAQGCGGAGVYACSSGCSAAVVDTLLVGGALFAPRQCTSGDADRFFGADVVDAAGAKLRLAQNLDGSAAVVFFPKGGAPVTLPSGCAQVALTAGAPGTGVSGSATLDCMAGGTKLTGTILWRACR